MNPLEPKRRTNLQRARTIYAWMMSIGLVVFGCMFGSFILGFFTPENRSQYPELFLVGFFGLFVLMGIFMLLMFSTYRCENCERRLLWATGAHDFLRPRWMPGTCFYPRGHFCPFCGFDLESDGEGLPAPPSDAEL